MSPSLSLPISLMINFSSVFDGQLYSYNVLFGSKSIRQLSSADIADSLFNDISNPVIGWSPMKEHLSSNGDLTIAFSKDPVNSTSAHANLGPWIE